MGTFLNAVKNLINSLTAKTGSTASTADMVQLHDANGTPNGKISLADLASVLGGLMFFSATNITTSGAAIGDYVDKPTYRCGSGSVAGSMTDKPDGFSSQKGFVLFNLRPYGQQSYMIQVVIQTSDIWVRDRTNQAPGTATWSTWKKVC